MLFTFLCVAVGSLALTNGANANFKGVASLYGSGTTSLKTALWWGTLTTFAGSLTAIFLSQGLLKSFSGKGLVPDSLLQSPDFTAAVATGAALTSFLATRLGFPVSTTHALVGALIGAGIAGTRWTNSSLTHPILFADDAQIQFATLGKLFLYPLLVSPLLAIVLGAATYRLLLNFHWAPNQPNRWLNLAHFTSAGAASFARGLNDTPKIAALLMITPIFSANSAILFIGSLIATGALLDAHKVAETLGKKITSMNPGQGFAANLVTASLVITASFHSLPVSTTHVSVGSLLGMGASTRQAKWKKMLEIFLAWLTTVPCAAILAAIAYALLHPQLHL